MRPFFIIGSILVVLAICGGIFWFADWGPNEAAQHETTYFEYSSEELSQVRTQESSRKISPAEAYVWDDLMFALISEHNYPDTTASRIYASLLVAQRDFSILSHQLTGEYRGSLTSVSVETLCLFFESECLTLKERVMRSSTYQPEDAFTRALAALVVQKIDSRLKEELQHTDTYAIRTGKEYWNAQKPWIGFETASWTPWSLSSGDQFMAPDIRPGAEDLAQTNSALANITDAQKRATIFWAGGPGTKTPPGQWILITDEYLRAEKAEISKVLATRAHVAMAAADAVIAVMHSKYYYWYPRPFMLDSSIRTIMPTPNHPTYPAGHSTISSAVAVVLKHHFPDAAPDIARRAEEAGLSRVWGGIHFPLDHREGNALGAHVGEETLRTQIEQ